MKKTILTDWDRKEYYEFFRHKSTQYFSVTFECDVTNISEQAKKHNRSLYLATIWSIASVVNNFAPMRQRLALDEQGTEYVVEYDLLNPLFTTPHNNGYFNYCFVEYNKNLLCFYKNALPKIAEAKHAPHFATLVPNREDMIFFSCIPNLAFTSISNFQLPHSYNNLPVTMPMIMWGKITERDGQKTMPIHVVVNHIFLDGKHLGELQELIQKVFSQFDIKA